VLTYGHALGEVALEASVSGEFGQSEDPLLNDIAAYAAGMNLGWHGFSVGGSYGNWGDSTLITTYTADDASYWDIGAAYEHDNWGVSIGYLESSFNDNEAEIVSLSADITPAPGMTPYVEASFFSLDHVTAADNDGTVVLAGVEFTF